MNELDFVEQQQIFFLSIHAIVSREHCEWRRLKEACEEGSETSVNIKQLQLNY